MGLGSYLEAHPFFFFYQNAGYDKNECNGAYDFILAGRFISGIACGLTTAIAPVYLNEIAPVNYKGLFGNLNQFSLVIGNLVVWVVGLTQVTGSLDCHAPLIGNPQVCPEGEENIGPINRFSLTLGLPLVFCVIQLLVLPFIWESPSHLAKFSPERAEKAAKYYGAQVEDDSSENKPVYPRLGMCHPLFFKPLIAAIILHLSQQLSGVNAIFFYSTQIFTSAGVSDPAVATCFIAVISVIFCGFSLWLVEKFGRKPLHMYGIGAIGICAGVMALLLGIFLVDDKYNTDAVSTCSIVFVMTFVAIFQCGPGPIPWGMAAELFDDTNRSRATAIGCMFNWGANTAVAFGFPLLEASMGGHVFWIFCGFNIIFFFLLMIFVPETKGKTLREIQAFFVPSVLDEPDNFAAVVPEYNVAFKEEEDKNKSDLQSEECDF